MRFTRSLLCITLGAASLGACASAVQETSSDAGQVSDGGGNGSAMVDTDAASDPIDDAGPLGNDALSDSSPSDPDGLSPSSYVYVDDAGVGYSLNAYGISVVIDGVQRWFPYASSVAKDPFDSVSGQDATGTFLAQVYCAESCFLGFQYVANGKTFSALYAYYWPRGPRTFGVSAPGGLRFRPDRVVGDIKVQLKQGMDTFHVASQIEAYWPDPT